MTGHVKVSGVWKEVSGASVKVGSTWKSVEQGFTKIGGVWKEWLAGVTFWLSTLGGGSGEFAYAVATDLEGNSYISGRTTSEGVGNDYILAKRDPSGAIQWQRRVGGSGYEYGYGVATDSNNNVYIAGMSSSAGNVDVLLVKYNSSGVIQWQRSLGGSSSDFATGVAVDSSDNVYVVGDTGSAGAGSDDLLLAKYNSGGTIQWQRVLGTSSEEEGHSLAIDSSDNVYVTGYFYSGGYKSMIAKYNSAGTIQWQRTLGGNSNLRLYSIAVDSSSNVYVSGNANGGAGGTDLFIAKYNSAGTIQWQKYLGGSGSDFAAGVAIDSSNNVYVTGQTNSTGTQYVDGVLIAKYNSAGTIQWQRVLGGTGSSDERGFAIAIDPSDNIYVTGQTQSTNQAGWVMLLAKVPSDGSLSGTYVLDGYSMVYASSSLTSQAAGFTSSTSSMTSGTSSLTSATTTYTSATATLTSHFVEIGA